MEDKEKIQLIKEEYFQLQRTVEDFDAKSITIKAWSVTGSLAAIGAGLSEGGSPYLFIVGSVASLMFWIIECHWKTFQMAYYKRIRDIEKWLANDESSDLKPLQISSSWSVQWRKENSRIWKISFWPHVSLPHSVIFIAGIILALVYFLK